MLLLVVSSGPWVCLFIPIIHAFATHLLEYILNLKPFTGANKVLDHPE
jgi:hypothetical protein